MIFTDESRTCIGQSNELLFGVVQIKYINIPMRKKCKFPKSFMIQGCMPFKEQGKVAIITSTINALVYIEMLDNFFIPLIELL